MLRGDRDEIFGFVETLASRWLSNLFKFVFLSLFYDLTSGEREGCYSSSLGYYMGTQKGVGLEKIFPFCQSERRSEAK